MIWKPHMVTVWCHECEKLDKELEEAQQEVRKLREALDWGETLISGLAIGEPPSKEDVWAWLELARITLGRGK